MCALYHLLRKFCTRHPEELRRTQVLIDVDSSSVMGAISRGRVKNREAHALLVQPFRLQRGYAFMLSLRWVPLLKSQWSMLSPACPRNPPFACSRPR